MSLDVSLLVMKESEVYTANITHNIGKMAKEAGLYEALWRPEEKQWVTSTDIIPVLEKGLEALKSDPERFKQFNPENGWGSYDGLVQFVERYLEACKENPTAKIEVCR